MDGLRNYVSSIKLPNYQELRNGEFFKKMFEAENPTKENSYLVNFENKLIYLQEVLIWTDVQRSAIWLIASQLFLYQFCLSATPVLSTSAYLVLIGYLYTTWAHRIWPAIKLPEPETPQDTEKWTAVHPDTYSAPEIQQLADKSRQKVVEIYQGMWLMRSEEPLRFCITMSCIFTTTAILGIKISTPVLIHSVALLAFILPPLLIQLARNDQARPCLLLVGEIIISISNSLVYTGSKVVPKETNDLDEFLPEDSMKTRKNLEITQSIKKPQEDVDYLDSQLAPEESIPSHEELELEAERSLQARIIQESDLLPAPSSLLSIEQGHVSDEDDDIMIPHGEGRLINVDQSDSDSDEFSLRGIPAPAVGRDTAPTHRSESHISSSLTSGVLEAATAYLPSAVAGASLYLPAVNQVLGSLVSGGEPIHPVSQSTPRKNYRSGSSEPNLDDFELISEEELEKESQNEFLG